MTPAKQKILLLLYTGLELGFTRTLHRQQRIFNNLSREWQKIDREKLREDIRDLYKSHLVGERENPDGSFTYVLTDKGKLKTLTYNFQNMEIKQDQWDGKWRLVIFDIPEKIRKGRDALREKLKELGFYEIQRSVLVFPHPCQEEIEFLVEFFNLRKFVRFATIESIDNDLHLRKIFHLS